MKTSRTALRWVLSLLLCLGASLAQASASGVVISQIYGGNGTTYASDYVELFNGGAAPVSISGWSLQYASATGTGTFASNGVVAVSGTLQPGQYYLVQMATTVGTGSALPAADATGSINLSATNGKVALVSSTTGLACNGSAAQACNAAQLAQIVDLVGYGNANFFEGSAAPAITSSTALLRGTAGCVDTDRNGSDFSTGAPAPRNSASTPAPCGGGVNAPIVASCPAVTLPAGVAGVAMASAGDADSIVNAAASSGNWPAGFNLGNFTASTADGGTATLQVDVDASVAAGTYSLPILWSNNEAQVASCTLAVTLSGLTPIYSIQGSGMSSPFVGQTVTTSGVVTKLLNNGYYLQDPIGDGNTQTSDGVFVFTGTAPTVAVGQTIRLSATVSEFNVGAATNADTLAHTVTELTSPTGVTVLSSGHAIAPVSVTLPINAPDELERYEGMLVTLTGPAGAPLTVSQNYFLGRFGELTLSANGRLQTPTNRHRPGADAQALADLNSRSTILLDDGTSVQNPNPTPYIGADNTVRAGDSVASVTGVIDFGLATSSNTAFGLYKVHPTAAPVITRVNVRTSTPQPVGGNVKVASFNVLNYFTTFTDGTTASGQSGQGCSLGAVVSASNCRGADSAAEFTRQRNKIVAALAAIDADVVGLMEIQNNGNTAVQNLVDGLNAVLGSGVYAVAPLPAAGTGDDAIRVAMIYKPARVSRVGASVSDPNAINNRPPLAQGFASANGEKFSVVVNHLKSKSSCPAPTDADAAGNTDAGDGQGCWNARRLQQAQQLRSFVGTVQAATGSSDVLLIGDMNSYAQEDPIADLVGNGFVDQIGRYNAFGYSYVFDGAAGRLDHAITTPSLSPKVQGAVEWHINADEPSHIDYNLEFKQPACAACEPDPYVANMFRASDHDPVVVGISLMHVIEGGASRDTLVGTPGDDIIIGGPGADALTGGAGNDVFVYRSMADAADIITDFTPGADRIDLSGLLASIGRSAADAFSSGVVRLLASGSNTVLQIDPDGSAGPAVARTLLTLLGVSPAQLVPARDLGVQ